MPPGGGPAGSALHGREHADSHLVGTACSVGTRQPARGVHGPFPPTRFTRKERPMLRLALAFLLIAIVAAVFGFTDIAAASADIAKIVFYVFLVLFLIAMLF